MDQQVFQLIVTGTGGLLTIIGIGIGWWVKNLQQTMTAHQAQMVSLMQQISTLNIELVRNYAPRAELQETFRQIFALLEDIRKEVRHA